MLCFGDENVSASIGVLKIVMIRVQASPLPWQAEVMYCKGSRSVYS